MERFIYMKATGIVRRIDDLGRVVIPKEIRRTMRIREGDPLEIYTEKDGGVIFRKYSPMGDLQEFAAQMCESIGSATGHIAAVSDRDSIIALHGAPKRELMDKPNSPELERLSISPATPPFLPPTVQTNISWALQLPYCLRAISWAASCSCWGKEMVLWRKPTRV